MFVPNTSTVLFSARVRVKGAAFFLFGAVSVFSELLRAELGHARVRRRCCVFVVPGPLFVRPVGDEVRK
ncbi:hypothetical protein [Nocardiopsis alborubida]|uniref:Uncharacterized protein n=1 Tax=Nocardiopsis alborubida TaxID=146802 RepID=A0A7X6MEQ5_9ACTN|nr:hypothetical protein [Nocardiopsis alborubida]NKY99184.1 hypothetical protein [Nocardiopsis alborubida]